MRIFSLILILVGSTLTALPISAESPAAGGVQSITVKPNGATNSVRVTDTAVQFVAFETTVSGNVTQYLEVEAFGPAKLKGYVEVRQKGTKRQAAAYKVEFSGKRKKNVELKDIGESSAARIGATTAAATEYPAETISELAKETGLSPSTIKVLLTFLTPEEIRSRYGKKGGGSDDDDDEGSGGGNDNDGGTSSEGRLSGGGLIRKDSCKKIKSYSVSFIIDLREVDPAAYQNGFTVTASLETGDAKNVAASIKPVSDGKFAPRPLLLIESMGYSYGGNGEKVELVKWKGAKPSKPQNVKIHDYVSYHGYRLTRSTMEGMLNGGSGSFDISNGDESGGVCLKLVRARQRANGYPS